MDRKILDHFSGLNWKPLMAVAGVAVLAAAGGYYFSHSRQGLAHAESVKKVDTAKAHDQNQAHERKPAVADAKHSKPFWAAVKEWLSVSDLIETYGQAFVSVQHKVNELRMSEEKSRRLALENAHLKVKLESARFGCREEKAASVTRKLERRLSKETGSQVGRTIASLGYTPPANLLPNQLYTLGISYFKSREDEKAAAIFDLLTGLEDVTTYKTPSHWLTAGIAWYRLDHFEQANRFFDQVISAAENPEILKYQAQARLWKALIAARQGKQLKAQYWIRELIDHHPHSKEAKWVNSKEVERATASVPQSAEQ